MQEHAVTTCSKFSNIPKELAHSNATRTMQRQMARKTKNHKTAKSP